MILRGALCAPLHERRFTRSDPGSTGVDAAATEGPPEM